MSFLGSENSGVFQISRFFQVCGHLVLLMVSLTNMVSFHKINSFLCSYHRKAGVKCIINALTVTLLTIITFMRSSHKQFAKKFS